MYNFSLMCFTLMLLFIGIPTVIRSQDLVKVDSLKRSLLNSANHQEKFIILNELFKQYNQVEYKVALEYATQFDVLAREIGDSLRIVEGGRKMAYSLMDIGKNEEAIDILIRILGVAERNTSQFPEVKKQIKFILNNAGIAYTNLGNYDRALEYHFKSLLIREDEGDKRSIATALNNIGSVYYDLKDSKLAIDYLQRAVNIKKEIGDQDDLDRILINIGLCYNQLGDFERGISYFNEGFSVCGINCADNINTEGLLGLGVAYLGKNNLDKAEDCFTKSLSISKAQNNTLYQVYNLHQLSLVESVKGNLSKAISLLEEAQFLAEAFGFVRPLIQVYDQFSIFYGQKSNYEKTAFYLAKYKQLKDSIYSDELIKNLAKVQSNFAERENIKTIKEQDQILLLRQQLIERQQAQYFFVVIITLLVLGLALVLLVASRKQQRASSEIAMARVKIEDQNILLAQQNKLLDKRVTERTLELSKSNLLLTEVYDELDNFLYKTSHDIRGPLATMQGLCNLGLIDSKDPVVTDILNQLVGQSDRMSKVISRLTAISNINQATLEVADINFTSLLDDILVAESENCRAKNIHITYKVEDGIICKSDELMVRTILENLISNGIKFYNSSVRVDPFVHIDIKNLSSIISIRIEDNGIGIPDTKPKEVFHMFMRASERSETGGVGLYLSKVCADRIGGEVILEKSTNEGTTFLVNFASDLSSILEKRMKWLEDLRLIDSKEEDKNQNLTSTT